jgi:hypothetical protein
MDKVSILIPSLNYMMDEGLHVLKMNSYFIAWEFITNVYHLWKSLGPIMDEGFYFILLLNFWWMKLASS